MPNSMLASTLEYSHMPVFIFPLPWNMRIFMSASALEYDHMHILILAPI